MSNQLDINVRMLLKYFIGLLIVHDGLKEDFTFLIEITHGPIELEFL
jgi:hypothetical protein